ncbi:hypothetical protein DJ564_31715 [Pseudomonas sp. 31-12]|uniref:hypothetical protein n=1 Tax=Pseudomonas sp. 31-12 TaxID=2201356 RepID=UPI000D6DB844|nr:hypothetical protein [Pseudomonas sp. 31-12]AWM95034.1 hypothetical protein DJ564_31715 [Pseudomonas sp. 31-12]
MKTAMLKTALIDLANKELREHPCYLEGMQIEDARMDKHLLVMSSNAVLMPGVDLNALNDFTIAFCNKYTLIG